VTAASVLWIVLGVVLALGGIGEVGMSLSTPYGAGSGVPMGAFAAGLAALGVAMVVLAVLMRRGRNGARIAVTVLGGCALLGCWTILLVAPAVVLQFLPVSNAWFDAVGARPR